MAPQIQDWKLSFIGGGNMGAAIIAGLLSQGSTSKSNIIVSEPWEVNRQKVESQLGVSTTTSNIDASRTADVLILAVKPQVAKEVCQELGAAWLTREH